MEELTDIVAQIKNEFTVFEVESERALNGVKVAARRCRKATKNLERLGLQFRKLSVK